MKQSLTSLAAQQAALTAENRALREEVAKLRERMAVLEKRTVSSQLIGLPVVGTPAPRWVAGSPSIPNITC